MNPVDQAVHEINEHVSLLDNQRLELACPNCNVHGVWEFYETRSIPIHSCLRVENQEQARNYERRDLRLGWCPQCGFIFNTVFDRSVPQYSTSYEETQEFSNTFSRFASELAGSLSQEQSLEGQRVLEIGCGKGSFLKTLCDKTGALGLGIDPSAIPERAGKPQRGDLEFIQDWYPDVRPARKSRLVCCRHTLEHIPNTRTFVGEMGADMEPDPNARLFIEVPDVLRILEEGAFWDIYYEHCSYFDPASLAHVVREAGVQPQRVEQVYQKQYIILWGRPDADVEAPQDMPTVSKAQVQAFQKNVRNRIRRWDAELRDAGQQGRTVVLWGGGSKAVAFLNSLENENAIQSVIDINPYRQGTYIAGTGHRIEAPGTLADHPPDLVIIMNGIYRTEIQESLNQMGLSPRVEVA